MGNKFFKDGGFYDDAIHTDIPDDAVALTDAEYEALFDGQASGSSIVVGAGGAPVLEALPEMTLEEHKTRKTTEINDAVDLALEGILSLYPSAEVATWTTQLEEARNWTADSTAETPFIDGVIAENGEEKADFVAKVLLKSVEYLAVSAAAIGQRQVLDEALTAATSIAEVDAIAVNLAA